MKRLPHQGQHDRTAQAPPLAREFDHAIVAWMSIGPRREATLLLLPLVWEGQNARRVRAREVRFGGIKNFAEVSAFLVAVSEKGLELAFLRYAEGGRPKPGNLLVEMQSERSDAGVVVQCSSLQLGKE